MRLFSAPSSWYRELHRGDVPRRLAVLARWRRQFGRIVGLSFLPQAERERRELAGEGHPRELRPHPPSDHRVVEVLERAGAHGGGRRRTLQHILEHAIVIAIQ